ELAAIDLAAREARALEGEALFLERAAARAVRELRARGVELVQRRVHAHAYAPGRERQAVLLRAQLLLGHAYAEAAAPAGLERNVQDPAQDPRVRGARDDLGIDAQARVR